MIVYDMGIGHKSLAESLKLLGSAWLYGNVFLVFRGRHVQRLGLSGHSLYSLLIPAGGAQVTNNIEFHS